MCGIIGVIGKTEAAPRLLEGLRRLEYRGYDSAGIAALRNGGFERVRAEGKLVNLEAKLAESRPGGQTGIGHTRWATHGVPNERNAHPHAAGDAALVHNGIIENYQELRESLAGDGREYASETDTEVIVHLISHHLEAGLAPKDAVFETLKQLEGAFALAIIFAGRPDLMIAARRGSPLAVGWGEGEMFIGSDALSLAPMTRRIQYLEDGDWAVLSAEGAEVFDMTGAAVDRPVRETSVSDAMTGKGGYRHYMLKEIYEQPQVIGDTLAGFINPAERTLTLPDAAAGIDWSAVPRITLIACGSSYLACLTAKYWLEKTARMPVEADIASEFRYRQAPMPKGGLAVFVSQSGETADTLAALRYAREQGQRILSIVNVRESTIARESDAVLHTNAGPEIGVASTKALTTQMTVLACLAVAAARARGAVDAAEEARLIRALTEIPARISEILNHDEALKTIAEDVAKARDVLYLGRGGCYPAALEGALKLKEISYIHAEGYAAGEMKHGPIALIDENVPVIVLAPGDDLFEKTASNTKEVIARGGRVIFISNAAGAAKLAGETAHTLTLPDVDPFTAPILYTVPVQLLAYHAAVLKGADVDQPRNLAKSVTVE